MKRKNRLVMYMVIISILILGACEKTENDGDQDVTSVSPTTTATTVKSEPEPKKVVKAFGEELKLSIRNPQSLNPLVNTEQTVDKVLRLSFESLFELDETGKPQAKLIESYTFADDYKYVTLVLKEGVLFHNGEVLTANDVEYSIDFLQETKEASIYKSLVTNVYRTSVIDDKTIRLYYKQPYAFALHDLVFPILNKAYYEQGDQGETKPMGTGPYTVTDFTSMKEIKFKYYDDYREDYWIEKVTCVITRDEAAENNALEQNLIDLITPTKFDWQQYSDDETKNIYEYTSNFYSFLGFNFNNELVNRKEFRQGIAYGINRESILEKVFLNHGVIANSIIPESHYLSTEKQVVYAYDQVKAKELIESASLYVTNQSIKLLVNKENTARYAMAEMIKEQLAEVGLEIEIDAVSREEFYSKLQSQDFDLVLSAWKIGNKLDFTSLFHTNSVDAASNFIGYRNEFMNVALESVYKSKNEEELANAIETFNEIFTEDLPYFSLINLNSVVITNDDVYGDLSITSENPFRDFRNLYISR